MAEGGVQFEFWEALFADVVAGPQPGDNGLAWRFALALCC